MKRKKVNPDIKGVWFEKNTRESILMVRWEVLL